MVSRRGRRERRQDGQRKLMSRRLLGEDDEGEGDEGSGEEGAPFEEPGMNTSVKTVT